MFLLYKKNGRVDPSQSDFLVDRQKSCLPPSYVPDRIYQYSVIFEDVLEKKLKTGNSSKDN